jgi:hypothetical protein
MLVCGIEFATVSEYVDQKRPKNNMKYDFRNKEKRKMQQKCFIFFITFLNLQLVGMGQGWQDD